MMRRRYSEVGKVNFIAEVVDRVPANSIDPPLVSAAASRL